MKTHKAFHFFVGVLIASEPLTTNAQNLGDLLKTIQRASTSDLVSAIKSISELTQGIVLPGTQPENAEGKIILYKTPTCEFCKRAATYMRKKGMPFVERDIERNANFKAEYSRLGGKGVPLAVFGDKTLNGFEEAAFDKYFLEFQRASSNAQQDSTVSATTLKAGDTMAGKIASITVYAQPSRNSAKVLLLNKTDEVIYMGNEQDGLLHITTQQGEGWVDKLLVKKTQQ